MRRLGRLCTSLTVLAAMVWCAAWIVGRDAVAAWVDDEVARLRAEGHEVEIAARYVGGFPFALALRLEGVRFADAAGALRTELAEVTTRVDVRAPTELVTELPPQMTLSLAVDPALRARMPELGPTLTLDVVSDRLRLVAGAADGAAGRMGLLADRLVLRAEPPLPGLDAVLEAEGLDWAAEPGVAQLAARLSAARLGLRLARPAAEDAPGETWTLDLSGVTGEAETGPLARLPALLTGLGSGRAALSAEGMEVDLEISGAEAADGRLALASGPVGVEATLDGAELTTESRADRLALALTPRDAEDPRRGRLDATALTLRTRAPVAPAEAMGPLRLALRADGLALAPEDWQRIDPDGALTRRPGALALEIDGAGRWVPPAPGAAPGSTRFDLARLDLTRFALDALGARAEAAGGLSFPDPATVPRGRVDLRLSGVLGLLTRLRDAGLIDEPTLQIAATTAALYTRGGDGPDKLVSEIELDADGVRVNGERVGFAVTRAPAPQPSNP